MNRILLLVVAALLLHGCHDNDTPEPPATAEATYLGELRRILGELRAFEADVTQTVNADTVKASVILPLIEERFRPQLLELRAQARTLDPPAALDSVQTQLIQYLSLRILAYDMVVGGVRTGRPELVAKFDSLQAHANAVGADLEAAIMQRVQPLPPRAEF